MEFEKELQVMEKEILNLKSNQRVASTIRTYQFTKQITVPAIGDGVNMVRLLVKYKDNGQPIFSSIRFRWGISGSNVNGGVQAIRGTLTNRQQYIWLSTNTSTSPTTWTFRMESTAEVDDVTLALE